MIMSNVIIFGTNDAASLARFYLDNDSTYKVVGFCVDKSYKTADLFDGLPLYEFDDIENLFNSNNTKFFAPLYDNKLREQKYNQIKDKGFDLITYVSSKATCWSQPGENGFIMEDNTIQPFVKLGKNIIMWSGNHIGHHSEIDDAVFFSSHVVLSGHCKVGKYSWFGVNSTIRDHVAIAENTFVCMGACIKKNTEINEKCK